MSATLTPFLFQTRTLARLARAGPVAPARLARSLHASPSCRRRQAERDPIPFELPPELENPDASRGAGAGDTGTITPLERQAFEEIFKEISEKGKSLPTVTPKKENAANLAQTEPNFLKGLYDGGSFNVSAIIQDAADRQSKSTSTPTVSGLDPLSPLQSTYSAADREEALLQFPPSLRRAARTAYGMMESARDIPVATEGGGQEDLGLQMDAVEVVASTETDNLARRVEMDASRREARLAIRAKMEKAENDFALWDVVEKEVFTLVEQLGLAAPQPEPKPQKQKRRRKKKAAAEGDGADAVASVAAQKPVLNMDTYGPIYPTLLLDALHMLDNKFSRPSPLAFSLLPRIKQLGLPSYVLGVSTSFYNKLLTVMWDRFGDVPGVFALLEEMRHAGLQFDEETKSVLHKMDYVLRSVERGDSGHFVKKMLQMPEYELIMKTRMSNWVRHIDWNINHRQGTLRN